MAIDHFDGPPNSAFFGVFYGHSGDKAAQFSAEYLHKILLKKMK